MKTRHHIVYMTTNHENGRFYIGKHSTYNLDDGYQGSGYWVKRSLAKGRKLNTVTLGTYLTEKDAYLAEAEFIAAFRIDCPDKCMNIADGGDGGWTGNQNSIDALKRSAEARKGKPFSELRCKRISEALIGKKLSEEHRAKLSAAKLGKALVGERLELAQKNIKKAMLSRCRWVVCLKTGTVFRSTVECARFWGISGGLVSRICSGKQTSPRFEFEYMDQ